MCLEEVNRRLAEELNEGEDVYIIDSVPFPVCKLAGKSSFGFAGATLKQRRIKAIAPFTSNTI